MESWDPVAFKALLRTTSQRLGQLQERKDSQSQLTRRDIATYLSHGHLALARAKAAMLIQEDVMGDLMEELEMLVGVVGSHVGELGPTAGVGLGLWHDGPNGSGSNPEAVQRESGGGGRVGKPPRMSPVLIEAAASIIYAAPSTESKDLNTVRDVLIQRLGPGFAQTASATRNNHVSPHVMQILSSPTPTASKMDEYLAEIAQTYGVKWIPELRREGLLNVISEILRMDVGSSPIVDLPRLREMSACGLPDNPPWIRPRIWRLLFGTLPVLKTGWAKESRKQRDSYYDLVRRLLPPVASLLPPSNPLSPTDVLLARISDSLFRVSPDLFALLGNEPKSIHLGTCPLDPTAPDAIRIPCASNLDKRLALLRGDDDTCETPEIRLESDLNGSPDITSPPPSTAAALAPRRQRRPTILLPSKAYNAPPAHRAHLSALLRLLYIHSSLNPAVQSPHVPWLLVPLYSALVGETDEDEVAHAEADTFWVFEALVGEIAELEEEDGGKVWTRKLSERIKWADGELAASLHATGLDPMLPHYSYRWLAPLLAQSLPLSSVLSVWDGLFACPARTRDTNPKLEYLVDVCTALLVRARVPLFRLGKPARNAPGLWTQEHAALPPPSPLRPWELTDAFTEGIALLTSYPIDAAGGIDRIIQTASDLAQKRIEMGERQKERERENVGFGARIKQQMWKGFTNQVADAGPEEEEEIEEEEEEEEEEETEDEQAGEHDDGNETETPAVPTLASRLANTVWRGITNQSSMDDEIPSPPSPSSAQYSPVSVEEQDSKELPSDQASTSSQAKLWDYAGKLKDSDTVAAFAKVSTNWRAKALDAWRVRKGSNAPPLPAPVASAQSTTPPPSATSEAAARKSGWPGMSSPDAPSHRRGSLPGTPRESENTIQDPPRPAFFRNPRESFLPQPRRVHATAPSSPNIDPNVLPLRPEPDTESSTSFIHRAGASLASLASLPSSHSSSTPKNIPRPLMLNSRGLITRPSSQPQPQAYPHPHVSTRSEHGTPEHRGSGSGQWTDVLAAQNRHALRQASVSSTSSLSASEALNRLPYPSYSSGRAQSVGTGPRSDYESDESAAAMGTKSRRVPLNRKSVSPMALASRSPRLPWNTSPSLGGGGAGGRSPGSSGHSGHPLSNGSVTAEDMETVSELGWRHFEERARPGVSTAAAATTTSTTTGFDSPTTIGSPPIPRTPVMPAMSDPGAVRIVNGGQQHQHVGGTSSISTLSEVSEMSAPGVVLPLGPPPPSKLVVRKKVPPLPVPSALEDDVDGHDDSEDDEDDHDRSRETPALESEESEVSMEWTTSGKAPIKIRAKRYAPRPGNVRLRPTAISGTGYGTSAVAGASELRTPSPIQRSITPEDMATTPKMESYLSGGIGREGEEGDVDGVLSSRPPFVRKPSREARVRKISTGSRETRRARDSGAEEGDDEGYDELLSAYESEEGSRE